MAAARTQARLLLTLAHHAARGAPRPALAAAADVLASRSRARPQQALSSSARASVAASSPFLSFSSSSAAAYSAGKDPPGQQRTDVSPARAHRPDSAATSGGPDIDPMTEEPRNTSTAQAEESAKDGAQMLADITSGVGRRRSAAAAAGLDGVPPPSASVYSRAAAEAGEQHAMQEALNMVPSGYSTTTLPVKADPLLEAFVNNLMRDGKKASAQRHILDMLKFLGQALHADPLPALKAAIQTAAPLVRMQSRKRGGKNIQVPLALREEQGRRKAIVAIIDASRRRGDKSLSVRLAKEIIAILEGSSSTIARKEEVHRLAMVNRGNTSVRI